MSDKRTEAKFRTGSHPILGSLTAQSQMQMPEVLVKIWNNSTEVRFGGALLHAISHVAAHAWAPFSLQRATRRAGTDLGRHDTRILALVLYGVHCARLIGG